MGAFFVGKLARALAIYDIKRYFTCMNSKQSRTLALIFKNPVPATMTWADIESLLLAIGAELTEGSGSRVRFEKDGEVAVFHRPHPSKEVKCYVVRDAQLFLSRIGVKP